MVFRLGNRALRTEIPLLPYDLAVRPATVRRPTQNVFLCTRTRGLLVAQVDPLQPLRTSEDQPDRLFSGCAGAPARAVPGKQRRLDRMSPVLRRDFHLREVP